MKNLGEWKLGNWFEILMLKNFLVKNPRNCLYVAKTRYTILPTTQFSKIHNDSTSFLYCLYENGKKPHLKYSTNLLYSTNFISIFIIITMVIIIADFVFIQSKMVR